MKGRRGERLLRLEDFPDVDAGAIGAEVATDKAKILVAAS